MRRTLFFLHSWVLLVWLFVAAVPAAADWTNSGGNAGRNGQSAAVGPDSPRLAWQGSRPSVIAWQPVIEGGRVFVVRQSGFPPEPDSDESPVVCQDLETGLELWAANLPYHAGDWTTWIAGVEDGRVYAARSGNGATVSGKLFALDAATGHVLWVSQAKINSGPYDGVVFAPDGDPVIADFNTIKRINAVNGATVFSVPRTCNVSGSCGGAIGGDSIYVADAVPGGNAIKRFDLATGQLHYASPLLPGFTLQNTPLVGPDGRIYLSRTQNNPGTDFFYAFSDTGSALVIDWSVPAGWSTTSEFAVGPDGSVYMIGPGSVIQRLDPLSGDVLDTSAPIVSDSLQPRIGVDALGRLFVSNGGSSNGRVYSFNPNLTERWSVGVPSVNIGAPAIGDDGTLVVAGVGTDLRAYRTVPGCAAGDQDADGVCDPDDCAPADGSVWSSPSSLTTLQLAEQGALTVLSWQPPVEPGAGLVRYDTLRSADPTDFFGPALCLESDQTDTASTDPDTPDRGGVFFYLVRVENDCPGGAGAMGQASDGTPHVGKSCP